MAYLQVTTGGRAINRSSDFRLAELEVCWKKLVEIGGRLPTATQLHQSFIKILSKHLVANKKVNFSFQQQSSAIPMMNPSPTEIVELFSFVEVALIQYATVAGHFPGVAVSSVKPKGQTSLKWHLTNLTSQTRKSMQQCLPHPRPKPKAQLKGNSQNSPAKMESKPVDAKKGGKGGGKGQA